MESTILKPLRIAFMAGFALLALFGLFLFANFDGFDNGQDAIGTVTIWGTLPEEGVNTGITALKETKREFIGVTYTELPLATFGAELAEALAIGEGPDMVLISQEQLLSESNKLAVIPYASISQRSYLDSFVPITELYLTSEGTYGVPLAVDPLVMYYNRTLLADAGIPQPPTTWEQVTGMADRMIQREGGAITRSLVAFGEYENVPNARAILSLLFLQSGTAVTKATNGAIRASLNEGAAGTFGNSAESALSFYTQFSDPAKTVYSWNRALSDARQTFLAGDLALYFGYASELQSLRSGNPNLDFDMTPVPQPQSATTRITYGRAYALAIPKTSKNPTGAYATAIALADKSIAAPMAQALSMVPAVRSALIPAPENRYQPVYFPEVLVARGWLSPSPAVTDSIFAAMIANITTGRRDVGQALSTANQALDSAL